MPDAVAPYAHPHPSARRRCVIDRWRIIDWRVIAVGVPETKAPAEPASPAVIIAVMVPVARLRRAGRDRNSAEHQRQHRKDFHKPRHGLDLRSHPLTRNIADLYAHKFGEKIQSQ